MELHLNNSTLKGSAEITVGDTTVACGNDILSTIIPILQDNFISDSNTFSLKCGRDNAANAPGQASLNSVYTENNHMTSGQNYASSPSVVEVDEISITVTQTYTLKIPVGKLVGPLGEIGIDFKSTNSPNVQTRLALPSVIDVKAANEITVKYTLKLTIPILPSSHDFEYLVDGVVVQATAELAYHNTNLYKFRHFLNHVGRIGGFRFAETPPSNLNNYVANATSNPTKTWTTEGTTSVLEFVFDSTQGNFTNGIGFFQLGDATKPYMSFTFNPPIPKKDSQKLRLFFVKDFVDMPTI